MKKIILVPYKREPDDRSRPLILRFLCFSLAFLATLQLSAIKAAASIDEFYFDKQNANAAASQEDTRELKPGETVERQIQPGEMHIYRIRLEAGTSVDVTMVKRDTPIAVAAISPDDGQSTIFGPKTFAGKSIGRVFMDGTESLVEPLVIVAEKTGEYTVALNAPTPGAYTLGCGAAHATTERDRKHALAGKLFIEIRQTLESGKSLWEVRDKVEQRAEIYRSLDDKASLALGLNDVARAYASNAEWEKAIKYSKEALEIFRSLNSQANVIYNLSLLGRFSDIMGDYQTAIAIYNESLSLSRAAGYKYEEASTLHSLGIVYHLLADEQKALEYYEQSLLIKKTMPPDAINGEPLALINMGNVYRGVEGNEVAVAAFGTRTTADRQKALGYYMQALEFARNFKKSNPGARTRESYNLLQIGNTYKELGNYAEALNYLNPYLETSIATKCTTCENYGLIALGNLYALKGEYPKSFEYYERSMALLRKGTDPNYQAKYFIIIARDYYRAGQTQKALELFNEAVSIGRARGQQAIVAESLYEMARIERDLGNFNNARNLIEDSIRSVEAMRARMTSQDVRTIFFSTVKNYYDFYVDLLMQAHKSQPEKGFDRLALQMSEQARSRSLLDLLTLSRIDIRQGIDPRLLEREKAARAKLSEKAYRQSRLLLGKHTKEEAEKIQAEVTELTGEYQDVQAEIKNKSPRYAALTQPAALGAGQIQQLLDSGTVLLEYALGEKKSYLWAVSADSVASYDLPPRAEIEAEARRVYELLTERNRNLKDEPDDRRRARLNAAEAEYPKAAARLSEMLLAPAASQFGSKRLVVVADGALNYISFAALPAPQTAETAARQPLGMNHEIVTLPSASILPLLREEIGSRKPAPKMVAVFADPIFNPKDTRVNPAGKKNSKPPGDVSRLIKNNEKTTFSRDFERAVMDVGLSAGEAGGLPRLPFSRREADSIYKVSPRSLSLKETDFEASKTNVFNSDLGQFRILHFATHGLLNSQHPELSGIVLSLVDKSGGEIDGFVRLQDIYNLELSAELVVLSACQTALGKDVRGEGLVSLTRGFMYAGAPRVVASLWKVDDAATAELMTIFYRKMLVENLRPAAALRAAQTEMMRQARWKSPYYWAGFVLQGEWR